MMHFLLSNDDGYQAIGIIKLASALAKIGKVTVVAPDRDRSGASNSLTLDSALRLTQVDEDVYYVNGTPTDCVHLAITGMLDGDEPDMVISGINAGANLGDDVLYSGTVAAAMEGRFLGRPAIAISLAGETAQHYDTAVKVLLDLVQGMEKNPLANDLLLNVNVPDVEASELGDYVVTCLGNRHKSEPAIATTDPRGKPVYWVGPVGPELNAGPGTDFHAIKNRQVSITPLQVDLTAHNSLDSLSAWVEKTIK